MNRFIISAALLSSGTAFGAEYRKITLANGREVPAEIKSITADEMVLQTPQGEMRISPNDLRNMDSMTTEEYLALPAWRVLVLPFGGDSADEDDSNFAHLFAVRVLKSIDAVSPQVVGDLPSSVGDSTRSALKSCGTDLQCATRHGATADADVVIMGRIDPVAEKRVLTLGAVFVDAPAARQRLELPYAGELINHRKRLTTSMYESLFLTPPEGAEIPTLPVAQAVPTKPKTTGEADLARLAWTPVPGMTALKQGNRAGFATAMGVVGAGTVASVYMAGHATYTAPQMVAMTALSSYGLTVLVNHMFLD